MINIATMRKGVVQKVIPVKDDEKYLEGINLVTGDKIDYARHILTETQINALCVSEKMSKVDKFVKIMTQGQKIQKWSLFENLALYTQNVEAAEKILSLIEKNYGEYEQFISILGEGLASYLNRCENSRKLISKKCYEILYRIILRTITNPKFQGSEALNDWMRATTTFFHFATDEQAVTNKKQKLAELTEFINGSFLMNTLPERRKTALEMIDALIGESQQIQNQTPSKILFFNNDLNPFTRLVICRIIFKILLKKTCPQLWKCVMDYYLMDKSYAVKDKAFQIICTIHFKPNAETIFHQFDKEKSTSFQILINYSPQFLKTYAAEVKSEPLFQLKVFSFLNRLLRQNMENNLSKIVQCYKNLAQILPETILIKELELKKFNLESMKVICDLIELCSMVSHIEFRQQLKRQIIRGLRYHEFYIKASDSVFYKLIDLLELDVDEEISYFILLFGKQIDNSKWKNVLLFMERIQEIKFYQSHLQKMVSNIIKIYNNCPYFMLQKLHAVVFRLLLVDRKGMEVYLKIREKCLGSKNWMLRRNFIKLYTYFKVYGSFELNKSITPLVYKNIMNQKNTQIKLEFVKQFMKAYSFLDPTFPQQKLSIKQVIYRFSEDKDKELAFMSQQAIDYFQEVDKNYERSQQLIERNKLLVHEENMIDQVIPDGKKHVKTQKLIGKLPKELRDKNKKGSLVQTKTFVALSKLNTIQKNKQTLPEIKPPFARSNSSQTKKEMPKFFAPSVKRSRF